MSTLFEQIHVGGDKNFSYLVGDLDTCQLAIVDPGYNPYIPLDRAAELRCDVVMVIGTHSHYDHIAGVPDVVRKTGAPFAAYQTVPGVDRPLRDGQTIRIGSVPIKITFCPGHAPDSILLLCDHDKLIVGDELFVGGVGKSKSQQQARLHHRNLHEKILTFPDETEVYPGHNYGPTPHSTIGHERRTNPFLLASTFNDFYHLRTNWKRYLQEHNIQWG
ncbi:MAG: MBL fold metallo-hydrolase [Planctomycetes bacterium]|nr:MBL fold metallo-hydrolase [Planctomycetota bacterium]